MFRLPGSSSGAKSSGSAKGAQKKGQKDGNNTNNASAAPTGKTAGSSKKKSSSFADLPDPDKFRRLRACMICSLLKTESQFETDGCDNCESFLQLKGTKGSVSSYTSGNFEGMIGMMNPKESWVAQWQRIVELKPGMYAVNVRGKLEKWVEKEMEDAGLSYHCRDKTRLNGSKLDKDTDKLRRTRNPSVGSAEDEPIASGMNDVCIEEEHESQVLVEENDNHVQSNDNE